MDINELKSKVKKTPIEAQAAPLSLVLGWLILVIYWINAFSISDKIRGYFLISKVERDAAEVGSKLSQTLSLIQTTSATLEPLKFVGVAFIIGGISLFLIAILRTLRLRGEATRFALIARKSK